MTTEEKKPTLKWEDLTHFIGTTQYWTTRCPWHPFNYTDGVRHVVVHGHADWILDVIGSYQSEELFRKDEALLKIQFWTLTLNQDNSAVIRCDRDEGDTAIEQAIPFTDFPLKSIRFYLQNMWSYWRYRGPANKRKVYDFGTLMLPSEY